MLITVVFGLFGCGPDDTSVDSDSGEVASESEGSDSPHSASDTSQEPIPAYRSPNNVAVAVLPVKYPDYDGALYPSEAELRALFDRDQFRDFFQSMSYGSAEFTVEMLPSLTHTMDSTALISGSTFDVASFHDGIDISSSAVTDETHFLVVYAPVDHASHGYTPDTVTYRDHADAYWTLNGADVTEHIFLSHDLRALDANRAYATASFDYDLSQPQLDSGEITPALETEHFDAFSFKFLHELGHHMGLRNDAQGWTNAERNYLEEPSGAAVDPPQGGSPLTLMGSHSASSPTIGAASRELLGWGEDEITVLSDDQTAELTLFPINRAGQSTIAYYPTDANAREGYFLSVREADDYSDFMNGDPHLAANLEGLWLEYREASDGELVSYLLDASPIKPGGDMAAAVPALDDIAIKPGMEVSFPRLGVKQVVKNPDGSFSVRVITRSEPSEMLGTPEDVTVTLSGDTATLAWGAYQRPGTAQWRAEAMRPDGTTVVKTVTVDQLSVDFSVSGDRLRDGTQLRVRARGGVRLANWSRSVTLSLP